MGMHKSGRNDRLSPGASVKKNDIGERGGKDLYLREYIARKQESDEFFKEKKPFTFDEWYAHKYPWQNKDHKEFLRAVWKAAQENKPLPMGLAREVIVEEIERQNKNE